MISLHFTRTWIHLVRNCAICKQLDSLHGKNGVALAICLNEFLANEAWCVQEMLLSLLELSLPFWVFLKPARMWKIRTWAWMLSRIGPERSCSVLNWSFKTYQEEMLDRIKFFKEFKHTKLPHAHSSSPALFCRSDYMSVMFTIPVCSPASMKLNRGGGINSVCQTNAKCLKCKYPQRSSLLHRVTFPGVTYHPAWRSL